jgi:hypothetical protein
MELAGIIEGGKFAKTLNFDEYRDPAAGCGLDGGERSVWQID